MTKAPIKLGTETNLGTVVGMMTLGPGERYYFLLADKSAVVTLMPESAIEYTLRAHETYESERRK